VEKVYWTNTYEKVAITYSNENFVVTLKEFNNLVWNECLKEASENEAILQMKNKVKALTEDVWDLIEQITRQ
jgi:hypothetical protein